MKTKFINNKSEPMKMLKFAVLLMTIVTLTSCGGNTSKLPANADGFKALEIEIKSKFGDNAYYTDLNILYTNGIGNSINLTVTEDPESLKMGQWNLSQNTWKQASEITLQVPQGSKAADFMFQLNDDINLSKLGELVEKSNKQLTEEKNIETSMLDIAFVKFPKNGDISKTEYCVKLKPEQGGTSFTFYYKLNGDLIKMDY